MPAARPSQASVCNAVSALVEVGLTPSALQVAPDGSFRIELVGDAGGSELVASDDLRNDDEPMSWDEVK